MAAMSVDPGIKIICHAPSCISEPDDPSLPYLPAAQAVDAERVRAVVYEAIAVRLCTTSLASMNAYQLGGIARDIADHVVTLLTGATP